MHLPSTLRRCRNVEELMRVVYPSLNVEGIVTPSYLTKWTILSAHNDDVNAINMAALAVFPRESVTYYAADKLCPDESNPSITNQYPNEFLNALNPFGLTLFKLELKVGCPIMLLQNIAPKDGLCNGTRLIVTKLSEHVIEATILTGDKFGTTVFIPRISLTPSSNEIPIKMTRRQFPIKLALPMTMNKSQGQSVKFVGIDLRTPVFSHGQLYVALSRCTSADRISILLPSGEETSTTDRKSVV